MGPGLTRKVNANGKSVQTLGKGKSVHTPSTQEGTSGADTGPCRNKRINTNGNYVQAPSMQGGSDGRSTIDVNHLQGPNTQGGTSGAGPGRKTRSNTNGNSVKAPSIQEGPGGRRSAIHVNHPRGPNTQGGTSDSDISQSCTRRAVTDGNSVQAPSAHEGSGGRSDIDVSHPQVPNMQEGESSSGTKKNVRKKTVNKKLNEFLHMGKRRPVIEILPHLTVSVGPWAAQWSNELGIIARTLVPKKCHTWADVKEPQKNTIFEYMLKRFDVDLTGTRRFISRWPHKKTF